MGWRLLCHTHDSPKTPANTSKTSRKWMRPHLKMTPRTTKAQLGALKKRKGTWKFSTDPHNRSTGCPKRMCCCQCGELPGNCMHTGPDATRAPLRSARTLSRRLDKGKWTTELVETVSNSLWAVGNHPTHTPQVSASRERAGMAHGLFEMLATAPLDVLDVLPSFTSIQICTPSVGSVSRCKSCP